MGSNFPTTYGGGRSRSRGSTGVINVYPAYLEVILGAQQTGQAREKEGTRREDSILGDQGFY